MRLLRSFPLCVLSGTLLCGTAAISQEIAPAARIVNPIDESQLVTLKGTVHPLANARNDRGAAPDEMQLERMHLVLKRSNSQESALHQLIGDLHTPGTASYHKWLTPDQFGKQFGPSDQDIATIQTWLTGHGFSVTKVNPGKQTIEFSGNVAQMRGAFHTQIHKYEVNGETHYANAGDPQIPAAVAPVVGGFVSLNNFRARSYVKYLGKAQYDPKTDHATPEWTIGGGSVSTDNFVLAPGDFAVQYDLNPLYTAGTNGSGQTIAIINESNVNIGQVNSFRSLFLPTYPANPPQVIIDGNDPGVDGINNPDGPNGASTEAYLDVEWAGAVAPDATVDLVIAADTALENGLILAAEHAVYSNVAPIMSVSFGLCENFLTPSGNSFLSALWEQAAAQGITVVVSTGDNGAAGCDNDNSEEYAIYGQQVNGYASTPYNVAVGGTDFYYSDFSQGLTAMEAQMGTYWNTTASNSSPAVSIIAAKAPIPEQPWNDSPYGDTISTLQGGASPLSYTSIAAGGGGSSSIYTTKPAWQTGFGDTARDLPDVSLFASNGSNVSYYPICADDGDCQPVSSSGMMQISGVGGTSASAPSFAGIMAMVNQKYGRQGQADFVLYPLAKQVPAAFNDVRNGTNTVPCDLTDATTNCAPAPNPITLEYTDSNGNLVEILEGMIGTGTTAWYNAVAGYDEASGLGTIDANQLVTNWGSVKFTTTTTTLTPSSTSFTHGTAITVSGKVTTASGTPTGDVGVLTDSTEAGQQGQTFFTLSDGSYTGTVPNLPGGIYNIWGQYSGDATNGLSSSTPVQITVSPENSGIAFNLFSPLGTYTSSSGPGTSVDYGTQLILSGQVTPSSDLAAEETCINTSGAVCPTFDMPTGTVTFTDGSTALNTAVINAEGDAEYNAPFSVGAHSVNASYSGDQSYNKSTAAAPIAFTVVKDTPVIGLSASNQVSSTGYYGAQNQPTVVNVQVENGAIYSVATSASMNPVPVAPPTGTITVSGFPSGVPASATLTAAVDPSTGAPEGVAAFTIPAGTYGNYTVTVNYPGDGNYNSSNSGGVPVQVSAPTGGQVSTTAATMTGNIGPTSSITITGTVTGQSGQPAPTGGVFVFSSGFSNIEVGLNSPASGVVSTFSITLDSQDLFQGANFITLQYTGDKTYYPSAVTLNNESPISNPLSDFSLVAQSTIVPISVSGGASSGTATINLASVNGFSGAVNLTCTAAAGVTCSIAPTAPTLSSGTSTTATLTIDATAGSPNLGYNVLITGADSTGKYVHTTAVEAVVTGSSVTASFGLTANPTSLTITQGTTTGNTSTITVSPVGSFTATVDLTCAVTTTIVGPAGVATCSMASPSVVSGSGTDVVTVTTSGTTSPGPYTVTITGMSGQITQTATVTVTVSAAGAATYAVTTSSPSAINPGDSATSTITVASTTGYAGVVTISCVLTTSPNGATDLPTCSGGAGTITLSSGTTSGTTTVSVTTTAASSSELVYPRLGGKGSGWTGAGGGAVLAFLVFLGIPARRRSWRSMLGVLVLMVALGSPAGCGGGGGGGGGGGNTGTTAGNYTFTVTGTGNPSQSTGNTTTFSVTVN